MQVEDDKPIPVRAKAVLVEPESMSVVWMNEATVAGLAGIVDSVTDATLEQAIPMAEAIGVVDALAATADDGEARHLRADVVSMNRGSMTLVVSVYRLPDGMLLVLSENTWLAEERKPRAQGRSSGRSAKRR